VKIAKKKKKMPDIDDTPDVPVELKGSELVIEIARAQLGKPYLLGAEGPNKFDCSGLVYFCFDKAGLRSLIGNERRRANWYYKWFVAQGLFTTDKSKAQRGDLIVYSPEPDGRVTHIGIWLDTRRQMVISAIRPVVTRHGYNKISVPVRGYLRVQYPD
jgi:cell wall-associated NlpC family hydrolase